ncbi:hypothetical protein GN956_G4353 [Arapaima gigas]
MLVLRPIEKMFKLVSTRFSVAWNHNQDFPRTTGGSSANRLMKIPKKNIVAFVASLAGAGRFLALPPVRMMGPFENSSKDPGRLGV